MFIRKKELDSYLVEVLKKVSEEFKANYEYFSAPKDDSDKDIRDEYRDDYTVLDDLREKITDIDSLSCLDEDDIDFIYQCLALYEGDFIISHINQEQQKTDERNHKKLMKLLDLFY